MKRFLLALVLLCAFAAPAWALDPDGTEITVGGGGSVVGVMGTFSFGATSVAGPPDKKVLLNGSPIGPVDGAVRLRIDTQGELYAIENNGNWWYYQHDCIVIGCTNLQLVQTNNLQPTVAQAQVHNAPGWIHSKSNYATGARVNNGPGWNEGASKFVPHSLLRAYQLISGSCTTAASGGPTGTASDIPDGTCHWKYLSDTDYVTLSGWANDANPWTAKNYIFSEVAAAGDPLTAYWQTNGSGCTSTTAPPAAAGDGCTWQQIGKITYASGAVPFTPWMVYKFDASIPNSSINSIHEAALWNDQTYTVGVNGEDVGFIMQGHNDVNALTGAPSETVNRQAGAGPWGMAYGMSITAAPGESFVDTLAANTSLPLTGADQTKGVMIDGLILVQEEGVHFNRLQLHNATGPVLQEPHHACDGCTIDNSIVEAFGRTILFGGGAMLRNDLIIVHGADSAGVQFDYTGNLIHSTIINPEGNGGVCIKTNWEWNWPGTYVTDSACFGFAHAAVGIANNCVDIFTCLEYFGFHAFVSSPNEPIYTPTPPVSWDAWTGNNPMFTRPISNATYDVNPSDVFVAWPGDYRLKSTSPLKGAGANYGVVRNRCWNFTDQACPQLANDSLDILGTTRPATGSDVGAWQTGGSAPTSYTITVSGVSNGTVISSPAGISCPGTCSASFSNATNVTLTETPNANFVFTGWGGNCSGTNTTCPLTTPNQFVTASFAANNPPPPPISNRTSRLNVHPARNPGVVSGLLEMPSGITGQQPVDVGTGPQDIALYIGPSFGWPRPVFYVVASDGVTDVQVTSSTTNPMQVTWDDPHDGNFRGQSFVFHGNWGITISKIKIREVTTDSLGGATFGIKSPNYAWPAVTVDTLGRGLGPAPPNSTQGTPYGQAYYYFGPKLADSVSTTSKGLYTNIQATGHPEVVFEPCNLKIPYAVCPPNFTDTETVITGVKKDGVTQSPGTLSSFISPDLSVSHTFELPAGTFAGAGIVNVGHVIRGQGMGVTTLDDHAIPTASGFKGILDFETHATVADMTLKNALGAANTSGVFNAAGLTFDHVEITQTQVGVHGGVFPSTVFINNSNIHDNGNDDFLQHELYINGGSPCMFNNDQIIAGERSDHALKSRCSVSIVNGGQIAGCLDPFEEVCGSVIDFAAGGMSDVQGMYSERVAGTMHAGDVLTLTFHSLVDAAQSDIVVTSTVAAGPPTATVAATALLTALQANTTLQSLGFYFSAGGTAKSTDTSDTINVFGPGYPSGPMRSWTITPTVTGSSHTTTLTQTMTPVELVVPANAITANGSTIVAQYQGETVNPTRVNIDNVHITNLASAVARFKTFAGGEIRFSNCKYSGIGSTLTGISVAGGDEGWDRVFGSCVHDSINVNPATISADGTTSLAGGSSDLITQEGTWHWGSATSGGNFKLMLNGVDSGTNTSLSFATMRVDHQGTMFAKFAGGGWVSWHGGFFGWRNDIDPTLITADGTTANAPSGTVNTWEGTWSFGAVSGSDRLILLNGSPLGPAGVEYKVANGGRLYVKVSTNNWYIWDGIFQPATPP